MVDLKRGYLGESNKSELWRTISEHEGSTKFKEVEFDVRGGTDVNLDGKGNDITFFSHKSKGPYSGSPSPSRPEAIYASRDEVEPAWPSKYTRSDNPDDSKVIRKRSSIPEPRYGSAEPAIGEKVPNADKSPEAMYSSDELLRGKIYPRHIR